MTEKPRKVDFLFLEEENIVMAHATGIVSDIFYKEYLNQIFNSNKLADGYKGLIDTRMVSSMEAPSSNALFEMARKDCQKNRKIAVLYSSELIFGLVRIYDSYNNKVELELFKDLDSAIEWLGIQDSKQKASDFFQSCSQRS
jgi:hypothetical protein